MARQNRRIEPDSFLPNESGLSFQGTYMLATKPAETNKDRTRSSSARSRPTTTRDVKERNDESALAFALVLFCSGAAALIYQVVWIKQLSLIVGVEVYSITIAVSAFFAGLALGGWVFGRCADRVRRPLMLFAMLEAGVAALSVLSTFALARAAGPFVAIEAHAGFLAWALPFLLVGAPAFLMGGTLPVAVRWKARGGVQIARAGGWIYAANTAGGIAGALLSSFVLLPWLGVRGTALAAAVFNLAAAGVALLLNRGADAELVDSSVERADAIADGSSSCAGALCDCGWHCAGL